jgi:hypothetical protein
MNSFKLALHALVDNVIPNPAILVDENQKMTGMTFRVGKLQPHCGMRDLFQRTNYFPASDLLV